MRNSKIAHEISQFIEIKRRILEIEPEIDERTLSDTLEGATNLNEVVASIIRSALDDESMIEALKIRLDSMRERLNRLDTRMRTKRGLAKIAMGQAGLEQIIQDDLTISLRKTPPSVVITDEALIPERHWIPQKAKLDKRSLLEALKGGISISGAILSEDGISLTVRAK